MKPVKKLLALILAGIMALALLTGCGKAASLNRTVAEGLAEYVKSLFAQAENENNISVSYQVPELSRNIAPLFDENWITKDNSGDDVLNGSHTVNGNKTVEATLLDILSPYNSTVCVNFVAADVTDAKTPSMEVSNLENPTINLFIVNGEVKNDSSGQIDLTSITSLKIAVTHKTVNGRTYALAVVIADK